MRFWAQRQHSKWGENGRWPRPNGLVISAGKCAGPIPAENCANAQKIHPAPKVIPKKDEKYGTSNYFPHAVRFSADYWSQHIFRPSLRYWSERRGHFHQNKKINHSTLSRKTPRFWVYRGWFLSKIELFLTQFWAYFLPLTNKFCCLFSLVR